MQAEMKSGDNFLGKWPNPVSFLMDYREFAVNARQLVIKAIVKMHSECESDDEKKLLKQLGMEQFFFLLETLWAFYCASRQEGIIDLYKWLREKNFNELNDDVAKLADQDLMRFYKSEFPDMPGEDLNKIVEAATRTAVWMKDLTPVTRALIPIFNRSKHKFLAYRCGDEVGMLLSEQTEQSLMKFVDAKAAEESSTDELSWLVTLSESATKFTCSVINIIIARFEYSGRNEWLSGPGSSVDLFDLQEYNAKDTKETR